MQPFPYLSSPSCSDSVDGISASFFSSQFQNDQRSNAWQKLLQTIVKPVCFKLSESKLYFLYISEVTMHNGQLSCRLEETVALPWLHQAILHTVWSVDLIKNQLSWWGSASSCPPGHPKMCCDSGAKLCWLEKASAHLTKLARKEIYK